MKAKEVATNAGVTMGTCLGIVISWSIHKSVLWAVIHGFFGWFYVFYYLLTK